MALLYNHATKQWEDIADEQAPSLVTGGTHTFEAGVQVPLTVGGELWNVPSEQVRGILEKFGGRLTDGHDLEAHYDKEDQKIQKAHFDNAGLAAGLGAARALTLGGSDVILNAAGVANEAKKVKEYSPTASTLGEVGGLVAGAALLPMGGVAGAAGKAGAAAEEMAARGFASSALGSRAGQIAASIAPKAFGSAVEGSIYGLGTGVSEAALGNPDDVASNLISNIGFGALFGGGIGAAFGGARMAKPFFDEIASGAASKLENLVNSAASKAGDRALTAALTARGEKEAAREVAAAGIMENSAEARAFRSALVNGDRDTANAIIKEAGAARTELNREMRKTSAGLSDTLKSAEPAARQEAQTALLAEANDAVAATKRLYNNYVEAGRVFDAHVAGLNTIQPSTLLNEFQNPIESAVAALKSSGKSADKAIARKLEAINLGHGFASEADRVNALVSIRDATAGHAGPEVRAVRRQASKALTNHPDPIISEYSSHVNAYHEAYTKMLEFTSKGAKGLAKLMMDPAAQEKMAPFLSRLSKLEPNFIAFKNAGANEGKKIAAASKAYQAYRSMVADQALAGKKLGFNEFNQLFSEYASAMPKDVSKAMERLRTLETATAQSGNVLDNAIRVNKALGRPTADLEKILPHRKQFEIMDRLEGMGSAQSDNLLSGGSKSVSAYIGHSMGGPVGAAVAVAGHAAYSNPIRVVKALAQIERVSAKGAAVLEKATKRAVSALISEPVRKGALILSTRTDKERPLSREERRKKYQKVAAEVGKYADPRAIADAMAASTGQLAEMPQIKMAMTQRLAQTAAYLNQYLPQDPIGNKQVIPRTYMPNDVEMNAYMRRVDAAQNPISVLHQIADGRVSAEAVDTLKTLYPDIYNKLQSNTISGIMDAGKDFKLPYRQRLLIKQVFGIDADYSQTSEFVGAMQANVTPKEDEGGRPQGATDTKPRKKIDVKPFTNMTQAQAVTYKGTAE